MIKNNRNEITVIGQKIKTNIEEIDIFKLNYWKDNPRINAIIKQKYKDKNITDEDLDKILWEEDSVKDLFYTIEKDGGLIDEIMVKGNIVLEGNSRLCAYRHLYKKAKEKNNKDEILKWSHIRAKRLPEETTNEAVFTILGTWHIKGKAQWDTYEKAAYFKRMNVDYGYSLKDIANQISSREKFVDEHIKAYDLMVENNIYTLEKFSYFYELVKNKEIRTLALKEPTIIANTIQAIKEDRFHRGEEIRNLPKVLKDKKAKKEFFVDKLGFNDAFETSKNRHPEYKDDFYRNIKDFTLTLQNCSIVTLTEEIKVDVNKKYILERFFREVNSFCRKVGIKSQK